MEELSMKNTLKAGDERKIEEEFFQYIVIRLGDEQYGIVVKIYEWIIIYLLSIRVVTRSLSSLFREEKALFLLKKLL